jgi:hypothetical protein
MIDNTQHPKCNIKSNEGARKKEVQASLTSERENNNEKRKKAFTKSISINQGIARVQP